MAVDQSGHEDGTASDRGLDLGSKIVVLMAGLISSLSIAAITSVLPQIEHALAHSATDGMLVKQLIGVVVLAMVLGSAIVGFLIDRYPISRIMIAGGVIYAIAGTAGLYLSDLWLLLASRFLVGVASAVIQVGCITLINKRLTGFRRAQWMGYHIFAAMFSGLICHPLAGVLGEFGWRWPFLLYLVGLLLVPAALMQEDQLGASRLAAAAARRSTVVGASLRSWFPFHYIALALCIGTIVLMPSTHIPFLLRDKGVTHSSMIALVMTADAIAGSITALFYGRARRYISTYAAFLVSFGTSTVGLGIAAIAPTVPILIVGLLIYGTGIGWFVPNLMTSLGARLAPQYQGRGTGLVKAAHFLSAPLSIALIEPITQARGQGAAFVAGAVLAAICFIVIALRWISRGGGRSAPVTAEQAA